LEYVGVEGRIIFKSIFQKLDGEAGLDCSGSGLELVAGFCESFGLHKMRGISGLAEELLASQEGKSLVI
jgi:hypothetical protein